MKTNIRLAIGSAFAMLLLAACNSATPAATAAPQQAPAATDVVPPTPEVQSTQAETTSETISDTEIGAALTKYASVSAYRAEMEMKGQGALGLSTDENNPNSPETSLFTLNGDFKGTDSHYTLKGFLSSLLGVEPDAGVEAMIAGGKYYVKGPISMLGATDDKWYVLQADQSEAIAPPFQVSDFMSALSNSDVQLGSFQSSGSETLDGKTCNVFSADKTEAVKTLTALNAGSMPGVADMTSVNNATAKFSVCDDGYIHRMEMTLDAASSDDASQKASFTINIHLYDYNADVTITPPTDATPLDASNFMNDTTTPSN
jgi:hypothetical protein